MVNINIVYPISETLDEKYARFIQVFETCKALVSIGCHVHLVVGGATPYLKSSIKESPITLHVLPSLRNVSLLKYRLTTNRIFYISFILKLTQIMLKKRVDCIYTRHLKLCHFLLKFKNIYKIPLIHEIHGIESINKHYKSRKSNPDAMESCVLKNVDGIISITKSMVKQLMQKFNPSCPILIAPDGVNVEDFPYINKLTDAPNICYIGHFYPWKGIDTLIKAMKLLDNAHLFLIGGRTGDKDFIRVGNLIKNLGVSHKITMTGFINRQNLLHYMHKSRIAVIPLSAHPMAQYFTSPLKLFEYMSTGLPIIAGDVPSIREILTPFSNSILVAPNDPESLANGIKLLIQDKNLSEKIRKKAAQDVKAYTWLKRAEKIKHFIQEISYNPCK